MYISSIASLLVLVSVTFALPSDHVLLERRLEHPDFVKLDQVDHNSILPVRIGLTQANLDKAYDYLLDVSHPLSSNYAKHWSLEQVNSVFAPTQKTIDSVRDWLSDQGISRDRTTLSKDKGWLAFDATSAEVERVFHARFHEYKDIRRDHVAVGCDEVYVPRHIEPHIDYITPGVKLSAPIRRTQIRKIQPIRRGLRTAYFPRDSAKQPANCSTLVTPACIQTLYQISPSKHKKAERSNALGVFESGDYYDQRDLDRFYSKFAPKIPNGTGPTVASIDGGEAPAPGIQGGSESALDLQVAFPLVYPQNITVYQVDDKHYAEQFNIHQGLFNNWLDALDGSYCNYTAYNETGNAPNDPSYPDHHQGGYNGTLQCGVYRPANVITVSYGQQEYNLPENYQKRQCNEYMKLGLRGVSILASSGDAGVAGVREYHGEITEDCLGPKFNIFNPAAPVNCPYITSVGGTQILPKHSVSSPEVVWNSQGFSSSGGFSNVFAMPKYQKKAISNYFTKYKPSYKSYAHLGLANLTKQSGRYNRLGRGMPDVSANAHNIATFIYGRLQTSGGTSASSPIFASIINRIVEERLRQNKRPLGFLNPALYENPSMFNDITSGHSQGCGTKGFAAVAGWDPVTGLGTPNYPKMLEYFLSLP